MGFVPESRLAKIESDESAPRVRQEIYENSPRFTLRLELPSAKSIRLEAAQVIALNTPPTPVQSRGRGIAGACPRDRAIKPRA